MRLTVVAFALLFVLTGCGGGTCEWAEGSAVATGEVWSNSAGCGPVHGLLPSISQYEDDIRLTFWGGAVLSDTEPQVFISQADLRAAIDAADPDGTDLAMHGEWFVNCQGTIDCYEVNGMTADSRFTYLRKGSKETLQSGEYHRFSWDITLGNPEEVYVHLWGEDWLGIDFWWE